MAKTKRRDNNHHLVWPRSQQTGIRKAVRQLPCLQVMLDIEVHRVLHAMYGVPRPMSQEDAEWLLMRHQNRLCNCYDPAATMPANILTINEKEGSD